MKIEISFKGIPTQSNKYVGWAPAPCQARLSDSTGATAPVAVTLKSGTGSGGRVVFHSAVPSTASPTLALTLPVNGSPVDFWVAGEFGHASKADKDAAIVATTSNPAVTSTTPLMVRVRKDANTLTAKERNRFLSAIAVLNDRGMGRFSDFRAIHTDLTRREAHGLAGFLPWHRGYLLDLERELQAIDPSVALPYWRFDKPAPKVFTRQFMGFFDGTALKLSSANPLQFWVTDQSPGIDRAPQFDQATETAFVMSEADTLLLGGQGAEYTDFVGMEGDPHGLAHTSFSGFIDSIDTAAKDPLFFMLHANVDRLWAKWQWLHRRFDPNATSTYPFLNSAGSPGALRIGHNLKDKMWPWNQDTNAPRPSTAPGGDFPPSPLVAAPGLTPKVGDMIDYQGVLAAGQRLVFDYDDVPFQF